MTDGDGGEEPAACKHSVELCRLYDEMRRKRKGRAK